MKSPHFFKAYCRLGVSNSYLEDNPFGVERAPDHIVTDDILSSFSGASVTSYFFPNSERPDKLRYKRILAQSLSNFKDSINAVLQPDYQVQVVVGGDHSVGFSSLLALVERAGNPRKIGYIQFDSHADLNTYKSSPSKNFHGMFLRPFLSEFDFAEIDNFVKNKLSADQVFFVGNLELDEGGEREFFEERGIRNITSEQISLNPSDVIAELDMFIKSFDYLHVSFDIDVFHRHHAPGTGTPSKDGLLPEQVFPLLEVLSLHPNLSVDLVEVNPSKDLSGRTAFLAQQVLSYLL